MFHPGSRRTSRSFSMSSQLVKAGSIHPALDQALDVFPVEMAGRAAGALQTLLHDRMAADGPDTWSSSRLTGGGFPVELTFATADDRLRYTLEPGSSRITPEQRLEVAIQLIDALGPAGLPQEAAQAFKR